MRTSPTRVVIVAAVASSLALACNRAKPPAPSTEVQRAPATANAAPPAPPRPRPRPIAAADALPALPELPPERRAIQVVGRDEINGVIDFQERPVDADAARARGLTVVDLSDAWAPSVLEGAGYRAVFTALAADRGDGDGQPLAAGERNYLELYG